MIILLLQKRNSISLRLFSAIFSYPLTILLCRSPLSFLPSSVQKWYSIFPIYLFILPTYYFIILLYSEDVILCRIIFCCALLQIHLESCIWLCLFFRRISDFCQDSFIIGISHLSPNNSLFLLWTNWFSPEHHLLSWLIILCYLTST